MPSVTSVRQAAAGGDVVAVPVTVMVDGAELDRMPLKGVVQLAEHAAAAGAHLDEFAAAEAKRITGQQMELREGTGEGGAVGWRGDEVAFPLPGLAARIVAVLRMVERSLHEIAEGHRPVAGDARAEERGARSSGGKFAAAKGYRPAASEEVRPIPQSLGAMRALSTQAIVSCANAMFVETGTSRVNPPYTVTLTDKTPSTGQATENGVVDVQGIHGHRIDKTIRLKIDIQDGSGGSSPSAGRTTGR